MISFAGGLPGSVHIDLEGIRDAARAVFAGEGRMALQYSTTDGYLPLREFIADRYRRRLGLPAMPDEIQIVNGSQQCLDLVAKIFLDPGDAVGMERPGYLGAIEAFSSTNRSFMQFRSRGRPRSGCACARGAGTCPEVLLRHTELPESLWPDLLGGETPGCRRDL